MQQLSLAVSKSHIITSSFNFFCLTLFLFPLPTGYSLCRHAPSAESFACSHWSICPRPPVVPIICAVHVWRQLPSFPIHTYLSRFLLCMDSWYVSECFVVSGLPTVRIWNRANAGCHSWNPLTCLLSHFVPLTEG